MKLELIKALLSGEKHIRIIRFAWVIMSLCCLNVNSVKAQLGESDLLRIDSLKQVVDSDVHDTTKINALLEWDHMIYTYDPALDKQLNLMIDSMCLAPIANKKRMSAKELIFYKKSLSSVYNHLGILSKTEGDYRKAIAYYEKSRSIAEEIRDKAQIAKVVNNIGLIEDLQGNYLKAISFYREAYNLRIYSGEQSEQTIHTINNLAFAYHKIGKYDSAIFYLEKAIVMGSKIQKPEALIGAYNSLGQIYISAKAYMKAFDEYKKAEALAIEHENWIEVGNIYVNIGHLYHSMDSLQRAKEFYQKSLRYRKKTNRMLDLGSSLNNIGIVMQEERRYDSALAYFSESLEIATNYKDSVGIATSLSNIGHVYFEKKQFAVALSYQRKALNVILKTDNLQFRKNILYRLYQSNKAFGRQEEALAAHEEYIRFKDSLERLANNEAILKLKLQSEFAQSALDSLRHKNELIVVEDELKIERLQKELLILILGLAVIFALSIYLWNRINQKRKLFQVKLENEVDVVNALMEGQEKERLRISQELHDGICSSLLAVDILLKTGNSEETTKLLKKTIHDIRLLSHEITPPDLRMNTLTELIRELLRYMAPTTNAKITWETFGPLDELQEDIKVSVFRVIQEALSNAIKYAQATGIHLSVMLQNHQLNILIEDDGKGFDANNQADGIGLTNIRRRVHILGGTLQIDTFEGHGTSINVVIDLSPKRIKA